MGGGKGGGRQANEPAQIQAQLSQQLFQQSDPLRSFLLTGQGQPTGPLADLLTQTPSNVFERGVLESQFGRARENILAGAPARGGQLAASLADLESQRALGVTGLAQAQQQRQIENIFRVFGGVTGTGQVALGGLGQAGSTLAAAGAAQQQSRLGLLGGLGTGIGMAIGAGKAPGSVKAA